MKRLLVWIAIVVTTLPLALKPQGEIDKLATALNLLSEKKLPPPPKTVKLEEKIKNDQKYTELILHLKEEDKKANSPVLVLGAKDTRTIVAAIRTLLDANKKKTWETAIKALTQELTNLDPSVEQTALLNALKKYDPQDASAYVTPATLLEIYSIITDTAVTFSEKDIKKPQIEAAKKEIEEAKKGPEYTAFNEKLKEPDAKILNPSELTAFATLQDATKINEWPTALTDLSVNFVENSTWDTSINEKKSDIEGQINKGLNVPFVGYAFLSGILKERTSFDDDDED